VGDVRDDGVEQGPVDIVYWPMVLEDYWGTPLFVTRAMGAEIANVVRMVLRQGMALATVGIAVGIGAATGVTRLMSALLFGVSPMDPLTYSLVAMVLLAVALRASYVPARRAASVDPMVALRAE